jgi:hypothetical protein
MTFSATMVDDEGTKASTADGAESVVVAMVMAANAPTAAFCRSNEGFADFGVASVHDKNHESKEGGGKMLDPIKDR